MLGCTEPSEFVWLIIACRVKIGLAPSPYGHFHCSTRISRLPTTKINQKRRSRESRQLERCRQQETHARTPHQRHRGLIRHRIKCTYPRIVWQICSSTKSTQSVRLQFKLPSLPRKNCPADVSFVRTVYPEYADFLTWMLKLVTGDVGKMVVLIWSAARLK